MRCLYEVLDVESSADAAVIKKSYRKLALQWHPDKNSNDENAQDRFQEIQNAWEVLSDPQERAWYDSHRNQILSSGSRHQAGAGGDGASEPPDEPINFAFYHSSNCFTDFDDNTDGFFAVYRALFSKIADQEQAAYKRQQAASGSTKAAPPAAAPNFGLPSSSEDFVRDFYGFWANFQTVKDFAWLDVYNASSAPGRQVRRLMEAENAKARKAGKLAFVAEVRELVRMVKAMDIRMAAFAELEEQRKAERQAADAQRRAEERQARQAAAAAYQDADWIRAAEEEQLAALDAAAPVPEERQEHECVVCNKVYRSEKALANHEASKKHKEALKKLKRMMRAEDVALDGLAI
eukprot:jgi/Ulvmu1/10289/UM060_0091.1